MTDSEISSSSTIHNKTFISRLRNICSSSWNVIISLNRDNDKFGPEDGQYMGFNRYPHSISKNRPRSTRELNRLSNMGLYKKSSYGRRKIVPHTKNAM